MAPKKAKKAPDTEVEEAPERAELAEAPVADTDAEFPTPWHREAYVRDLERELAGAKLRVEELTAADAHPQAIADAATMVGNARAELARLEKKTKKGSAD